MFKTYIEYLRNSIERTGQRYDVVRCYEQAQDYCSHKTQFIKELKEGGLEVEGGMVFKK
jgi:uncharacterized protein YaaR (DUF327 family)